MSKGTLLLVDDDRRFSLHGRPAARPGCMTWTPQNCCALASAIAHRAYDVALLDVRFADGDGFDLLADCRRERPRTSVIMITGYGTVDSAVEAIRQGAFDFSLSRRSRRRAEM